MLKDAKMEMMRTDTRLMIFLFLPTRPVFREIHEYVGIITPPSVQIAGTTFLLIEASAKKPHHSSVLAEMQVVSLQHTKIA
jgi:hypothetical protein